MMKKIMINNYYYLIMIMSVFMFSCNLPSLKLGYTKSNDKASHSVNLAKENKVSNQNAENITNKGISGSELKDIMASNSKYYLYIIVSIFVYLVGYKTKNGHHRKTQREFKRLLDAVYKNKHKHEIAIKDIVSDYTEEKYL